MWKQLNFCGSGKHYKEKLEAEALDFLRKRKHFS